jgi:arylsulfatase A-like enzyme
VMTITADNGFLLGDHGLAGKWIPYEESLRIPLVIFDPRLPRVRAGACVDAMALTIDLAPTFLDLAGIEAPPTMQGKSLAPLMAGVPIPWRNAWYYEHRFEHPKIPKSEAVRTSRRLYARYHSLDRLEVPRADGGAEYEQLFDLEHHGLEGRNVVGEAGRAAELEGLRELLRKLREEAR